MKKEPQTTDLESLSAKEKLIWGLMIVLVSPAGQQ